LRVGECWLGASGNMGNPAVCCLLAADRWPYSADPFGVRRQRPPPLAFGLSPDQHGAGDAALDPRKARARRRTGEVPRFRG
jgi:hypothetical protein